jgi:hypothetical protein
LGVTFLKNLENGKTIKHEVKALWEQWVRGTKDIQNMIRTKKLQRLYNHVTFSLTTAPLIDNPFCASSSSHTNKTLSTF